MDARRQLALRKPFTWISYVASFATGMFLGLGLMYVTSRPRAAPDVIQYHLTKLQRRSDVSISRIPPSELWHSRESHASLVAEGWKCLGEPTLCSDYKSEAGCYLDSFPVRSGTPNTPSKMEDYGIRLKSTLLPSGYLVTAVSVYSGSLSNGHYIIHQEGEERFVKIYNRRLHGDQQYFLVIKPTLFAHFSDLPNSPITPPAGATTGPPLGTTDKSFPSESPSP